jgi:hypothetical protein
MSTSLRQSELFAGDDWRVLYRAFTQVNFNASDPPSIALAMRQYLQVNYPEDYNDYIESSEFMFLLELVAWTAGILAFKTDINARENFLESAEARESILRLARFLSYNPRRNQAARGLVKLVEVETDDDIVDSYGISLANTIVEWDNPDDPDWFERFILVLNNAFVANNQFGQPISSGTVGGIRTQSYRLNNSVGGQSLSFSATTGGERTDFELCNGDFDDLGGFTERVPNTDSAFQFYYRADGNGNSSNDTGFFMLFKQGSTNRQTFSIAAPIENQILDIETTGINETDVWVQTINDSGTILVDWEKVPSLFSDNITFNSLPVTTRNIFQVITRDDDRISIRFSDGRFGSAPYGNIRVTYRTSNGLQYTIRPQEIDRIRMPFRYTNRRGVERSLYLTFSLQTPVSNSALRETDEQIRRRAPQVYATQNRMVSGEDYNIFPLQSNLAMKLKAINRTYSGHSRFIDLNDPTGNYQDTNVFSDDGIFYNEAANLYTEVITGLGQSVSEIVSQSIQPLLSDRQAANYAWSMLLDRVVTAPEDARWRKSTSGKFSSTGYFTGLDSSVLIRPGAILEVSESGVKKWVSIDQIDSAFNVAPATNYKGPVTLTETVADNATITRIIPRYLSTLGGDAFSAIEEKLQDNTPFTLWYNYSPTITAEHWEVGSPDSVSTPEFDDSSGVTRIKMLVAERLPGIWRLTIRGLRYVFESVENVQWYFEGAKTIDGSTGLENADLIRVLPTNEDVTALDTEGGLSGRALQRPYDLAIDKLILYADGYAEPRRVSVRFFDSDEDGQPDDPDTYVRVIGDIDAAPYLFWERSSDGAYLPTNKVIVYETRDDRVAALADLAEGTVAFELVDGSTPSNTFWQITKDGSSLVWTRLYREFRYRRGRGPNVAKEWYADGETTSTDVRQLPIAFQWKHYAPTDHRIDPSKTNIIDIFVLTNEYDYVTRQWIANGAKVADLPLPPSELDLRLAFADLENYSMFSDGIVWRPVQYKFLFGTGAPQELRAQFKVVKLSNSTLSDGEIKSRVIRAINEFFDVSYWDFGDTFYYTELSGFIHQRLAGSIASIVLVPLSGEGSFGEGFEIRCRSDELFISTAQVSDVVIINSNTAANLRIR